MIGVEPVQPEVEPVRVCVTSGVVSSIVAVPGVGSTHSTALVTNDVASVEPSTFTAVTTTRMNWVQPETV